MSPTIEAALEELTTELDGLLGTIQALRLQETEAALEEMFTLYKKRDQLANVINNLRAYYSE